MTKEKGYRFYHRTVSLFLLLFIPFLPSISRAESKNLTKFLWQADENRLYDDRYWHILLHYKPSLSGFKSLIDDPNFFLSPVGKEDPKGELEAMIRALFESEKRDDEHPKCRFPARYEWLQDRLDIDESIFSDIECKGLKNIIDIIQPRSAVMVFPSFFMNNPASMFGHTLIRIDSSYQSSLLSYAANYAAYPDKMNILYPFKGIFGFYKGYYSIFPYYDMVKKYNDTEQRDMWEYHLNLSEEEVHRMLLHLWELKDIYSYYYFFDENCSFNLLFLLESARPTLHLTDGMEAWVIPVDTIRAVKESGIVDRIDYRPALATRMRYITSLMDEDSQKMALKVAAQELEPGQVEGMDRVKILDLAIETIQYRYNKNELSLDDYQKLFLSTLKERSKLGSSSDTYKTPVPLLPEDGHLSSKISLGAGLKRDKSFMEVKFRPAYHSLIDMDYGYLEGLQIQFADTTIRYYSNGEFRLEDMDLIDVVSLTPRDNFFKPLSFKIGTGLTQKMYKNNEEYLIYQLKPGVGLAYKDKLIGLYYIMAETNLNIGGMFRDSYTLGAGIGLGTIKKISKSWKVNLSAEGLSYGLGDTFEEYNISAIQSFGLSKNNLLDISFVWKKVFEQDFTGVKLGWSYYF